MAARLLLNKRTLAGVLGAVALAGVLGVATQFLPVADISPLDRYWPWLLLALLLAIPWLVLEWRRLRQPGRADAALRAEILAVTDGDTQHELAVLSRKLDQALEKLKRAAAPGKGLEAPLYQLPWYMMIGPPKSGKSTAVAVATNVQHTDGERPTIKGAGGTRNCEWMFTENAILLDTAGRYLTHEDNRERDSGIWLGFLDMLRRVRSRQPINGVIVAIGLDDLAQGTQAGLTEHARLVRARLRELSQKFTCPLPAYVMFTKADLLQGFAEFFATLKRPDLEQVWGATLPLPAEGTAVDPGLAAAEFDALLDRLRSRRLDRMDEEVDAQRRAQVLGFPQQFALLRDPLLQFLNEVFTGSRYDPLPVFRGFYFTSAVQMGNPIDRLTASIGRHLVAEGVGPQPATRTYFLKQLLNEVIFAEAWLGAGSPVREERRRRLRRLGLGLAAALSVVLAMALTLSFTTNMSRLDGADELAARYAQAVKDTPAPTDVPTLEAVLPALDLIAPAASAPDDGFISVAGFGLSQSRKLANAAGTAYESGLAGLFLPRVLSRLETRMRGSLGDRGTLYETLKIYLMLARQAGLDKPLVLDWLRGDLSTLYPDSDPRRAALDRHMEALVTRRLPPAVIDDALVAQARDILDRAPLAQQGYDILKGSAAVRLLPAFDPLKAAGPLGRALVRRSGLPLRDAIPGLYTRDGFLSVIKPALDRVADMLLREHWVLGRTEGRATDSAALRREVMELYLTDYIRVWDTLLSDVTVPASTSPDELRQLLLELSGNSSPLAELVRASAEQTRLTVAASPAGTPPPPEQKVEEHFRDLHHYAQGTAGMSVQDTRQLLRDLYEQANVNGGLGTGATGQRLLTHAGYLPAPAAGLVRQTAQAAGATAGGNTRSSLSSLWASTVLPTCRQVTSRYYPLNRTAEAEVPLPNFTELFGPGGLIDNFFRTNLVRFVDMSQETWRWQPVDGIQLGIPDAVLWEFQRADRIRRAFFPAGPQISVRFDLQQMPAPGGARPRAVLHIDGQSVGGQAGAGDRPVLMQWPANGIGEARLEPDPMDMRTPDFTGPWALFRLLDRARLTRSGTSDTISVSFATDGGVVTYRLRPGNANHPFGDDDLWRFRCPTAL
ncbi:type VI secretion system membrane subunit TssM [Niveispirillum sp. KHB5.9]|uniref:type VI secretion system membrane subunit TssM n=1 Tax=Niveispirillum sp. KHB5.9 TaxID=3400269 RepID=UPI003A8BA8CC